MEPKLKYIGRSAALPHVPARDLTEADFTERRELWEQEGITEAVLLSCGLYERNDGGAAPETVTHEPKKRSKRGATQGAEKEGE